MCEKGCAIVQKASENSSYVHIYIDAWDCLYNCTYYAGMLGKTVGHKYLGIFVEATVCTYDYIHVYFLLKKILFSSVSYWKTNNIIIIS